MIKAIHPTILNSQPLVMFFGPVKTDNDDSLDAKSGIYWDKNLIFEILLYTITEAFHFLINR